MEIFRSNAAGTPTFLVSHAPAQLVQKGLAGAEEAVVQVYIDGGYQDYLIPGTTTVLKLTATIKDIQINANGAYRLNVSDPAGTCVITFEDGQL